MDCPWFDNNVYTVVSEIMPSCHVEMPTLPTTPGSTPRRAELITATLRPLAFIAATVQELLLQIFVAANLCSQLQTTRTWQWQLSAAGKKMARGASLQSQNQHCSNKAASIFSFLSFFNFFFGDRLKNTEFEHPITTMYTLFFFFLSFFLTYYFIYWLFIRLSLFISSYFHYLSVSPSLFLPYIFSWHSVGAYPETSSNATCQETFDYSRLSLLGHCGLILA